MKRKLFQTPRNRNLTKPLEAAWLYMRLTLLLIFQFFSSVCCVKLQGKLRKNMSYILKFIYGRKYTKHNLWIVMAENAYFSTSFNAGIQFWINL